MMSAVFNATASVLGGLRGASATLKATGTDPLASALAEAGLAAPPAASTPPAPPAAAAATARINVDVRGATARTVAWSGGSRRDSIVEADSDDVAAPQIGLPPVNAAPPVRVAAQPVSDPQWNSPPAKRSKGERRQTVRWTDDEEEALIKIVKQIGVGDSRLWSKALHAGSGVFSSHRTNVDLKDKWKNLNKQGRV